MSLLYISYALHNTKCIFMKDRIQEILNSENLTRKSFAEMIKIQASAITHIINGRNKPSMDVVQNILTAFPKISPEWLIMGTGNMYKNDTQQTQNQNITIKTTKNEPFMRTLFDDLLDDEPKNSTQNELTAPSTKTNPEVRPKENATNIVENVAQVNNLQKKEEGGVFVSQQNLGNQINSQQQPIQVQQQTQVTPTIQQQPIQQIVSTVAPQPRTIKKIIILYSDNTFEELSK